MISVNQAISIIKSSVEEIPSEDVKVTEAMGRILSLSVKSAIDSPPFDMSSMDGYAIKTSDRKKKLKVVNEVFAGDKKNYKINNNETIRVFTGSKIPKGANCVVIQEEVKYINANEIFLNKSNYQETFIRKKGQDYKKKSILLKKNHQIKARDIGLLVSSGIKKIKVYKKPKVVVLATGNELIAFNNNLNSSQIYASSLYMIKELLELVCADCIILKIIKDNEETIEKSFKNLKIFDLIITTGGVSVGKKDLVKRSLENIGMKTKFWKVKVRPGKPLLFGIFKNKPTFGLPGNPVSSFVCFIIFVLEAIKKMNNFSLEVIKFNKAILEDTISNKSNRETYFRGYFYIKNNKKYVRIFSNQDSSLMKTLSLSNCLVRVPNKAIITKNKNIEIIELDNGI